MSGRIVYVNGNFEYENEAKVSIFDRGFLFADAVYEVTAIIGGKIIEWDGHIKRLERSLNELDMTMPYSPEYLLTIHRKLIKKNSLEEGLIYLQISRGEADRDFEYPDKDVKQTVVLFTQVKSLEESKIAKEGIKVISVPDIRWDRRDIKTVQLLPPSMCKMMAKKVGKDDAWMTQDGYVTEGTSNNAYIITKDNTLVTRNLSKNILAGVTRLSILKYAKESQIKIEERPFTIEEAKNASEAFCSSATTFIGPVVEIDNQKIGDGKPGEKSLKLREIYIEESIKSAM
ncbi:MAG: D-amino-acid transaminase [Candidatus Puniceispirillales bacterium]